jgi:Uncharacterised nucleotidyltransferase
VGDGLATPRVPQPDSPSAEAPTPYSHIAVHTGSDPDWRDAVANIMIDRLTAEVAGAFDDAGIDFLVMKGPVIASWLYPAEVRPYGDSDILVPRRDWERAAAVLQRLGFSDYLGPLGHPRMESFASTAYARGDDNVDLHCTLAGLDADLDAVWPALAADPDWQVIAGREVAIPARPAVLMHVAIHAAHHGADKPLEDLRRAIARADDGLWRRAAELAEALDGLAAFASGLRLLPEGAAVAARLGVQDAGSVPFDLRASGVATAEALHDLLTTQRPPRERLALVLRELFPSAGFMRWWTPLARRGRGGLLASYPWRWVWLALRAPRGLLAVRRARRARG